MENLTAVRTFLCTGLLLGSGALALAQEPAGQQTAPDNTKVNERDRSQDAPTADQQKADLALVLSRLLLRQDTSSDAIAAYEAEMFARMRHMTEDTIVNTEMFYAPDASDRVVARSETGDSAIAS